MFLTMSQTMSDESREGVPQPVFPQDVLGQTNWRIHVPSMSYETYLAAQRSVRSRLRQQLRRKLLPTLVSTWLIVFFGVLILTAIYKLTDFGPVILFMILSLASLALHVMNYQRIVYRNVFEAGMYHDFTVSIGDNGILLESKDYMQFFTWSLIGSVTGSKHGLVVLTRSYVAAIIPEADLQQIANRDAMLAFIEAKIARATDTGGSSRPAED